MKKKKVLDERQEQELLQIEHKSFWIAYAGLIVAFILVSNFSKSLICILATGIPMLAVCAFYVGECIRHGIWSRTEKPSNGKNVLYSLLCGVIAAIISGGIIFLLRDGFEHIQATLLCMAGTFLLTFIIGFATFSILKGAYNKAEKNLEKQADEQEKQADELE